jgi:hypothetical protein
MPRAGLGVAAVTAAHGALLSASLGRAAALGAWPAAGAVTLTIALLALGAGGAALGPGGAVAHVLLPAWLLGLAARGRLTALGLRRPLAGAWLLAGAGLGAALGGHLLLSAALTLGYRLRHDGLASYLAALAYDLGANVPSGELFFRGVLFDHLQRRRSFTAGAAVATGAYLGRYLLDPRLPATVETITGAVLYLSLLSLGNCWLVWRSGNLGPALASSLAFFAAYRALAIA